jgi:hypothetical protein
VYQNNQIDKYDIIGFAAMTIDHVYGPNDSAIQGTSAQDYVCTRSVPNNRTIGAGHYAWDQLASLLNGGPCQLPPTLPVDSAHNVSIGGLTPADYTYDGSGITLAKPIQERSNVAFTLHNDAKPGICGDVTLHDNSAVCLVAYWQGDTITGDYTQPKDNITVIRLCDPTLGNCLDQRHGLP